MQTTSTTKWARRILGSFSALALAAVVIPVGAEEDAEGTPEEQEHSCVDAVESCDIEAVGEAYSEMRQKCNAFRQCKRGCDAEKKDCKHAAKVAKRDCNDVCKSKSGKEKRDCKQACNDEKKDAKAACRKAKRDCNNTCRKELKDTACVKARNEFWTTLGAEAKSCLTGVSESCEAPFPKKD
jgi:hypothetical protein